MIDENVACGYCRVEIAWAETEQRHDPTPMCAECSQEFWDGMTAAMEKAASADRERVGARLARAYEAAEAMQGLFPVRLTAFVMGEDAWQEYVSSYAIDGMPGEITGAFNGYRIHIARGEGHQIGLVLELTEGVEKSDDAADRERRAERGDSG